jgi:hypothetical protein
LPLLSFVSIRCLLPFRYFTLLWLLLRPGCFPLAAKLSAGIHGTELREQNRRTVSGLLPGAPFQARRINAPRAVCWPDSVRSRRLVTTFRSLGTTACFQTTIPRSKLPACYFNALPNRLSGPFDRPLPLPRRFAPGPVGIKAVGPFPGSRLSTSRPSSNLHSPLGALTPAGSERSIRFGPGRPTFRLRPIVLRSPQPFYCVVPVADHRSELATFPQEPKGAQTPCLSLDLRFDLNPMR